MKNVDLRNTQVDLVELLHLAEGESVLVVSKDGHEFILAEVDDFDDEVQALRNSPRFQSFLDQRMKSGVRIPIEEIEKEIEEELSRT